VCSQLPDAIIVAAQACCESTLCSFSCNCGELAMVNAVKKAMTIPMPMLARGFMPAGDLVDAGHCASFSNLPGERTQMNSIRFLVLTLFRWQITERLRIGVAILGSAGCQPAVRGNLPRTDFERTLDSRKKAFGAAAECSRLAACAPQNRLASSVVAMASAGQRSGVALRVGERMIGAAKIYFIVFGILTIAGGIVGYVKAGSMASIIAGSISGVLLLLAAWLLPEHQAAGLIVALVVSLLLAGQFIPKFFRTFKVMPAGLMSVLSAIGIIVAIAAWLRK